MGAIPHRTPIDESQAGLLRRVRELEVLVASLAASPYRLAEHRQWPNPFGMAPDVGSGAVGPKPHSSGDEVVWRHSSGGGASTGFLPDSDGTRKVGGDWGGGTDAVTNFAVMNLDGESAPGAGDTVIWLIRWELCFWALDGTVPAGTEIQVKPRIFKPSPLYTISYLETRYTRKMIVPRDTTSGNRIGFLGGTFIQPFLSSAHEQDDTGGGGSNLPPGVGLYLGASPSTFLSVRPSTGGTAEGILSAQRLLIERNPDG